MKIFRRSLFGVLVLGSFGLLIAPNTPGSSAADYFALTALGSVLGLQVWSFVFLKTEPMLARIGLIINLLVAICFLFWLIPLLAVRD